MLGAWSNRGILRMEDIPAKSTWKRRCEQTQIHLASKQCHSQNTNFSYACFVPLFFSPLRLILSYMCTNIWTEWNREGLIRFGTSSAKWYQISMIRVFIKADY